jgi:hypothetical protein
LSFLWECEEEPCSGEDAWERFMGRGRVCEDIRAERVSAEYKFGTWSHPHDAKSVLSTPSPGYVLRSSLLTSTL